MITFKGIHHVSLEVTDLAKAKTFYGQVLGLRELARPPFDFPGAWYEIGTQQLHLIENKEAQTKGVSSKIDTRGNHFAIRVHDYADTVAFLESKHLNLVKQPNSTSGFSQVFCQDPDGNTIEFNTEQK